MTEMPVSPMSTEPPEQPKKSNTWIWIVVAVVVVLCCCCVVGVLAWQYGDAIMQQLQG